MSELRLEHWTIPTAPVGPENPLPAFDLPRYQPMLPEGRARGSADDIEAGFVPDYLPYPVQDGYTRQRQPTPQPMAVLENETLRAAFLLDWGGRLWSLVHKPSGRELLYVNPMLQPANLAMRNAWFSGGVEWNMGVISHTPFTCAPLFAARLATPDGTPVLRLYEWERIRQAAYQIDAYLPDGSSVLYVRVRLVNPHDHPLAMYWWSNIAVPEADDVRVIVPTERTIRYALSISEMQTVPVPIVEGEDITYTTRFKRAADYFFQIPPSERPYITALDASGAGLIQTSTSRMFGRKLFLWGTGQGGKRWQEWLSGPNHRYLEIQAGLATTQLEYATMPPHAEWSWLEGYGLMQADKNTVHGVDWGAARHEVESHLETISPRTAFEAEYARGETWKDQPPQELLHHGAEWGALERLRREQSDEPPFASAALTFETVNSPTAGAWRTLLDTGKFPDTDDLTGGLMVQREWRRRLEASLANHPDSGWEAWLHVGIMRLHDGDWQGAWAAWEASLTRKRTAYALRNLAVLARQQGQWEKAAAYLLEAHALQPDLIPLLVEAARTLIDAGRAADFLALLSKLPEAVQQHGRVQLLEVEAALAAGEIDRAAKRFADGFEIVDYREGDEILTELWHRTHLARVSRDEGIPIDAALSERVRREYPLPSAYDFRMKETD
ncbi:MAG: DUF5107 domain-containing protein [Anaerolineae bacterium]